MDSTGKDSELSSKCENTTTKIPVINSHSICRK